MMKNQADGVVIIETDVDVEKIQALTAELEKAAPAAERLAEAMEHIKSVFGN